MDINLVLLKKHGEHISVLYVEDDELIREQTTVFLSRFFPNIDSAEDGLIGLEKYKQKQYDLVISDINMPNMNGIEMIKAIREITPHQIILVTSAYNDSEHLTQLINLEVMRFVSKPFENKPFLIVLYKIVEELMHEREKQKLENDLILMSKRAQEIVDEIDVGIVLLKDDKVEMANKAFLDIGDFDSLETLLLEMPDIGVLFEETQHCLNATTNAEFILQLQSVNEDEKKVRIIQNSKTYEYRVSYKQMDDKSSHILTFTDITAIHNSLNKDTHTNLPMKKFILEKIEIFIKSTNKFKIILLSVKNFNNVIKWYGKNEAIELEVAFANKLKAIKEKLLPNLFIGHFGQNQFIVIEYLDDSEEFYEEVKNITITSLHLKDKHEFSSTDFHLTCLSLKKVIDSNTSQSDLEVDLINSFESLS